MMSTASSMRRILEEGSIPKAANSSAKLPLRPAAGGPWQRDGIQAGLGEYGVAHPHRVPDRLRVRHPGQRQHLFHRGCAGYDPAIRERKPKLDATFFHRLYLLGCS